MRAFEKMCWQTDVAFQIGRNNKMRKKKLFRVLMVVGCIFMAGGCAKKDTKSESINMAKIVEEQANVEEGIENAIDIETVIDTRVEAETESEPETKESMVNTDAQTAKPEAENTKENTPEAAKPEQEKSSSSEVSQTGGSIKQEFQINGRGISTISCQMPEDWEYTTWQDEGENARWGISVKVQKKEDATISIFEQSGTVTEWTYYINEPETFQTAHGVTARLYQETMIGEGDVPYVSGAVMFEDSNEKGVVFLMPQSIYIENEKLIHEILQSIEITHSY